MELRHLRYFVAVAEEGSLTVAAERRLHTAQPSLSRQIRDLEQEVGVPLLTRTARGVEMTAAGRIFLDHARLALSQADVAKNAARRAAQPSKPSFAMGFLTGYEVDWLAEALRILRGELANVDVVISSHTSPDLAKALQRGDLDVAFMRAEVDTPDLTYTVLARDPIVLIMPNDHRLTAGTEVTPSDLVNERFINVSQTAPTLLRAIDDYIAQTGLPIVAEFHADNISMAAALVASTGGVALLPAYVLHLLPATVTSRPLSGRPPGIELALGYRTEVPSPLLQQFLSHLDELVGRVKAK
jgi:LysR family hca operon transcriptional activator